MTPCRYFATCDHLAAGFVANPVLGPVPCCDRCREVVGADFMAPDAQELDDFAAGYIECALWADLDTGVCLDCGNRPVWTEADGWRGHDEDCASIGSEPRTETGAGADWPEYIEQISPELRDQVQAECSAFMAANLADLREYCGIVGDWNGSDGSTPAAMARAGHNFRLTRSGHGAGFWTRGLGELGDRLTAAAETYGDSDIYVGDNGLVYGS